VSGPARSIVFESYGVTAEIVAEDPERLPAVEAVLPPGWGAGDPDRAGARFELTASGDVIEDGRVLNGAVPGASPVERLESAVRAHVALNAPAHVFVHAGAVVHHGRAMLIPGSSFSGKTTLVAALVARGAAYASDEFAVLDADGLVHPFPKPLSMRRPGELAQTDVHPADLAGDVAVEPVPVGLIVVTSYFAGWGWDPRPGDAPEAALSLLSHTVVARTRPAQALPAVRAAAEAAEVLVGYRGEADLVAQDLLERRWPA
jgi:hypothetical protein